MFVGALAVPIEKVSQPLTLTMDPEFLAFARAVNIVDADSHYGDPSAGCESDEVSVQITGIKGDFCTSACSLLKHCPTDVPAGVTAKPQCALQDASQNKKYCALICDPSAANSCGKATCKSISGTGICTYDDMAMDQDEVMAEFAMWKNENSKVYSTQEEHDLRLKIFTDNKAIVEEHNAGNFSWTIGMNKFADLTPEEFQGRMGFLGEIATAGTDKTIAPERHVVSGDAPASVDWRDHKMVNPIKNQEQCGSCWAFSTVDSYESAVAKSTGTLTSFSEQDLVDCVKDISVPGGTQTCCDGCQGGLMDFGFQYLIKNQGGKDTTEAAYPYTAKDGKCSLSGKSTTGAAPVTSFKDIAQGDEAALTDACGTVGVISVAVNAGVSGWQLYTSGVFDPFFCNGQKLDHGVAVVGYGTDDKDYWIIRNSWGASWGEEGYMRIVKGKNKCGLANSAVYPVV